MAVQTVDQEWLDARGGLHDARIIEVVMHDGDLLLFVSDEWANFKGLAEYPGIRPGKIRLHGVNGTPRIDSLVTKELVMEISVEKSDGVQLTVVCFGDHTCVVCCNRITWERSEG